jgi:hypothetical protein
MELDLPLSVQSVPIATKAVSWNLAHGKVYMYIDSKLCDKFCQWLVAGQWYFLDTSVSSTNDGHDITEILLKEVLNNKWP